MGDRQRVAVVTGGGGGIGAAIAEELGRRGAFVVTVDPLVTLDGSEQLPPPQETTADRIVAAGGSARASSVSVTDRAGVDDLLRGLVDELGGVDAVVNVAGITRPTSFAKGSEEDWRSVLAVHLDGYLNMLAAALPIMAAQGHGRILGVTSGSGWRPANAGAYSCAKRAVAALTWQLGRDAPPGVVINAISPIAATRMVAAALGRARPASGKSSGAATGGLSLDSMPTPEQLGPLGAHLVDDGFSTCHGQVLFAGGSEVAVIDEPRLLEVVRTDATSLAHVLEAVTAGALVPAEARQATSGGSNSRFGAIFDEESVSDRPAAAPGSCAVVTDLPEVASSLSAALAPRGISLVDIPVAGATTFEGAAGALAAAADAHGPIDAVVVALSGADPAQTAVRGWERVLAEHSHLAGELHADSAWARAASDHAARTGRALRLVTLTDATTSGGRSRAQAAAQLARAARGATEDRVSAFSVSVEQPPENGAVELSELVAHLLCSPEAPALAGAELVAGGGWVGLRSHPRPTGSITFGGPAIPPWFDDALRGLVS